MATIWINIDFPTFLISEGMPQRDTPKYSSSFLRSDGIDTRCSQRQASRCDCAVSVEKKCEEFSTPRDICSSIPPSSLGVYVTSSWLDSEIFTSES